MAHIVNEQPADDIYLTKQIKNQISNVAIQGKNWHKDAVRLLQETALWK